jgi:aminoglycoside phosphotransferase (APT) family kinase protein
MRNTAFAAGLDSIDVEKLLRVGAVQECVGDLIGNEQNVQVTRLSPTTFQISGANGDHIVRFPRDQGQLGMLRIEENVQAGMRSFVSVRIPDTAVVTDIFPNPPFAIHRKIPGRPLTSEEYVGLPPDQRDRLVEDLAVFFVETHVIPLRVACRWLDLRYTGSNTAAELATIRGKPLWFSTDAVAEIRSKLTDTLDKTQMDCFRATASQFNALKSFPDYMVFGHGDMHGYNMAIGQDDSGPRLVGVFDLGCVGILDCHEDFFRLSLISEDLLERVIGRYSSLTAQNRSLDRHRIAVYYRAFLFYLMADQSGEGLAHLKRLLRLHLEQRSGP